MSVTLGIASFNCRGIYSSQEEIRALCNTNKIVCIQEHWLAKQELHALNTVCDDFRGTGSSPVDLSSGSIRGRPHGGVGVLWHKSLDSFVSVLDLHSEWACGINVSLQGDTVCILSVYLPYECDENQDDYIRALEELKVLVDESVTPLIFILGDYNTDILKQSTFSRYIEQFLSESNLLLSDNLFLDTGYTYVSDAWGTTSWLDHCICTETSHSCIVDIDIHYGYVTSDHLPLTVSTKLNNILHVDLDTTEMKNTRADRKWIPLTEYQLLDYIDYCILAFNNIPGQLVTASQCNEPCCMQHRMCIDQLYDYIVHTLLNAYDFCRPSNKSNCVRKNYKPVSGWTQHVQNAHTLARESFLRWHSASKPRTGPLYDSMKHTRSFFNSALRQCKRSADNIRADSLAQAMSKHNHKAFWKNVKVQQNAKTLTPATIGEAKGTLAITEMWAEHFQSVLASDATCSHDMKTFIEDNNVILYSPDMCVTSDEICDAVNYLKFGKSSGLDEIFAEHIVAAGEHVIEPLRMLMSAMLIHGYMPEKLMNGVIIPVTKNRNKSISDKQNYRPISLSNIISKIFECILLKKLQPYIGTCVNQFGYKPNSGTELCIFTLKEYLNYYHKLGSHIFTCFMDASAAFDRIKFIKLFKKLKKRKTPLYLIRVLSYW